MNPSDPDSRVRALLDALTPQEKVSLTAGRDVWHLPAVERLGIGTLEMSDGPSGVRGNTWSSRTLSFPCGTCLGATWDPGLIERIGLALGDEARAKGIHLLLGPTIGIPRTPLGGRTFESFAEDPLLTSLLAVAYIRGVQSRGVGCCVKHLVCNDQEQDRMTISVEVDERALREVHLAPFEAAVIEGGVWSVMAAYNRLRGIYCAENEALLDGVLRREWGFDGVVVSDWLATHSTMAASAGLDVEMPGPPSHFGDKLLVAIEEGRIDAAALDVQVGRILRLAERCGVLDQDVAPPGPDADDPRRRRVAREAVVAGSVLLANDGILPVDPSAVRTIAVLGPKATRLETGGGGSSLVTPYHDPSPVDELRRALPGVNVLCTEGCRLHELGPLDPRLLGGGFDVEIFESATAAGPLAADRLHRTELVLIGEMIDGAPLDGFVLRARTTFTPDTSGQWLLALAAAGTGRLLLDGEVLVAGDDLVAGSSFFGLGSEAAPVPVDLVAGDHHELVVELTGTGLPISGFEVQGRPPVDRRLLDDAVAAAREADLAIVMVGADRRIESEGADRADLRLPGGQDDLVRAVAVANPRTVVVVNSGAPVAMPWVDDVAAILTVWYPGDEGAAGLADMLVGTAEPAGRLPISFPRHIEDTAAHGRYPGRDGIVTYEEGSLVGYRHHLAADIDPLFPFGHGLGYTSFDIGVPEVQPSDGDLVVTVPVINVGHRAGTEVVQVYVAPLDGHEAEAPKLGGFAKVTVEPGATEWVVVAVAPRALERWDSSAGGWVRGSGAIEVAVGRSSERIDHRVRLGRP